MRVRARRGYGAFLGLLLAILSVGGCGTAKGAAPPQHRTRTLAQRRRDAKGKPGPDGQAKKRETPALLPLTPPSAQHPLTMLVIGDSLGEDLGMGLRDLIGAKPAIRLYTEAVGSTGLVNTAYYNWPLQLEAELGRYHRS